MGKFYSYDRLDSTGANIRMVYSLRSNGKTYGALIKCLELHHNYGGTFFLLHRRSTECTASKIRRRFSKITNITDYIGADRFIGVEAGEIFSYARAKNGKRVDSITLGYYGSLDRSNELKTDGYNDVTELYYDEFLSSRITGLELVDEYTLFINAISSIRRTRPNFTVYMMGNTVNRHSCYFDAWHIDIDKIAYGDIRVFEYPDGSGYVNTIAVEYAKTDIDDSNRMFNFGTPREQAIINGVWETSSYPTFDISKFKPPQVQYFVKYESVKLYLVYNNNTLYISDSTFDTYSTVVIADIPTNVSKRIYNIHLDISHQILSVFFALHKIGQSKFDKWTTGDSFEQLQSIYNF